MCSAQLQRGASGRARAGLLRIVEVGDWVAVIVRSGTAHERVVHGVAALEHAAHNGPPLVGVIDGELLDAVDLERDANSSVIRERRVPLVTSTRAKGQTPRLLS